MHYVYGSADNLLPVDGSMAELNPIFHPCGFLSQDPHPCLKELLSAFILLPVFAFWKGTA